MSSDTENASRLDRILRLWISLWTIVLEEKRHLETVCAVLQRVVFEMKGGMPTFKNWAAICEVGHSDPLMMMVLATLDMSKAKSPMVANIIAAFPLCFSTVKCGNGPYPLSVIRARAEAHRRETLGESFEPGCGAIHPVFNEAVPKDVPIQGFDTGHAKEAMTFDGPMLPEELLQYKKAPQGTRILWGGKSFIVIENNTDLDELHIVPAECIAVDL